MAETRGNLGAASDDDLGSKSRLTGRLDRAVQVGRSRESAEA